MYRRIDFSKLALVSGLCLAAQPALAGYEFKEGDLSGSVNLNAGAATISTHGVNFGTGKIDSRSGENEGTNARWQEFYIKPGITLQYQLNPDFQLLGGASVMGATTFGDGDAGGNTRSSDGAARWEELYAGFQAGDWKFTAGRQNYLVGNGFIVMDGNLDALDKGAYWLGPRTAFNDSAILGWSQGALQAQAFTLRADDDLIGDYRMTGANIDYAIEGVGKFGAMAFRVNSEVPRGDEVFPRDGKQVYNLRALGVKVPGIPALTLDGEYAVQKGNGHGGIEYDAKAWYLQGDYAFTQTPWPVNLGYRYLVYSGDDDVTDNTVKAWDPLSKGFTGWGTWLVGDIMGNYLLFNSNERVQQFYVKNQLTETVALGAIHYQFWLDEKNFLGAPVSERRFADESVLYLDWTPTDRWYASLSYNWAKPKGAAKEFFGDNNTFSALELYVLYHY